ncbi:phosphoinositide phospholipase C 6-like isoform X2 [Trifolium pratense]|uniref:phosphoinositide phospholipase C 6-like isoform X2 n=1 Tax=Trifolium pratense TaxID=57577 RepID=UPI001E690EBA|nr:phosphoinositide phospholipase C 6-like isoform X2 [Trifolium pratense]
MKTKIFKLVEFLIKKGKVNKEEPPYDLKEAFTKFTNGENHMSKDQLLQFMVEYQGEQNCTLLDLEPIFEKLLQNGSSSNESTSNIAGLSLDKFIDFLLLDDFNGPLKNEVHHDMNAPLSHYFMYTGHNSYLTGNQLTSESSDEPIIEALKQGVRVIELDLWASTKHGGIKVVHGRTLTTPVPLTKCLESIKEHAFVKSDFPVILTLEDHLTPKLQAKFAEVAVQIFGEMLYCPQTDFLTEFPSPASLKKMIVISTKPPKEYPQPDGVSNQVPNGSESSEDETWELQDSIVKLDKEDINTSDYKSNQQSPREYRQLITIHGGKSEGTMKDRLKVDDGKVRRLSLSEKKLKTASESHGADLIRFTQKNILRIFPKGERVKSSNFRPHLGWMYGAQMVAFNMQGYGKSLRLMQGMFKANGGCGYVKKPEFLIQEGADSEVFDPKRTLPVKQILKVCIVGVGADCTKKRTRVKMDNWYPVWDEEFEFQLTVPELALLRIEVKDKDQTKDDFAGQTCLPVSELRCGFRSVRLCDRKGKELKSVKLLLRFELETL